MRKEIRDAHIYIRYCKSDAEQHLSVDLWGRWKKLKYGWLWFRTKSTKDEDVIKRFFDKFGEIFGLNGAEDFERKIVLGDFRTYSEMIDAWEKHPVCVFILDTATKWKHG